MPGRHSPLHDWHTKHQAEMIDDGGWEFPNVYSSVEQEVEALVDGAGIADLCHEGRFRVQGGGRQALLERLVTANLEQMPVNSHVQTFMLTPRGGIIDEINIFKGDTYFLLQTHVSTRQRVLAWLQENCQEPDVEIQDASSTQGTICLRGRSARAALEATLMDGRVDMAVGRGDTVSIGTARCLVLRHNYSGTDAYQIIVGSLYLQAVWDRIFISGGLVKIRTTGFAAREVLRLEAGIPRMGVEMDEETTPLEAGLAMRVEFKKGDFTGKRALLHSSNAEFARRLVALRLDTDIVPPVGTSIEFDGMPIGHVTSSGYSPRTRRGLAMGFVDAVKAKAGRLQVRIDNQLHAAESVLPTVVQGK